MTDNDDKTPETDPTVQDSDSKRSQSRRRSRTRAPNRTANAPDPSKVKFFRLVPENTNINFIGNRKKAMGLSLGLILLTFVVMAFNYFSSGSALNYGIDFQGGSSVRLALTEEADVEQIRTVLEDEGYSSSSVVLVPDAENEVLIRVKAVITISEAELAECREAVEQLEGVDLVEDGFNHPTDSSKIFMKFTAQTAYAEIERAMDAAGCEGTASAGVGKPGEFPVDYALVGVGADIANAIESVLGEGAVDHIVSSETVGAKVGDQLKSDGVQAMLFATFFIFLYVMIRFDLRFAPAAIVALVHDSIVMIGAFALTGKEFNLQSIAAVLTVIGYSINDTIVVFDRIRERVALFRDAPVRETTNRAINETLSRTVLTSTTTLLVVVSTWVLGSGVIKDFAFALTVGLIAGTYSSIFVASPVFLWVNDRMYKGKGHLLTADADAEAETEEKRGTGTLLGPQVEEGPDQGAIIPEEVEEGSVIGPRTGSGPQASADVQAAATGQSASVRVEDVDKQAGERKSRRRRRRPKQG